jgi:hypothetical protein
MPTRTPPPILLAGLAIALLPAWLRGRRSFSGEARELMAYRSTLGSRTARVDTVLDELGELVDALRRRAVDVDEAVDRLTAGEDELDATAEEIREMAAPEDLHSLHLEYEANLERALRGIVTAERGCGLTRQRHRPPDDDEPISYWKRGYANIVHARLRMEEIVEVMLAWEPGRPAVANVSARVRREG